jgi:hypothetical protein
LYLMIKKEKMMTNIKLEKELGIEEGLKITEKDLEINPVSGRIEYEDDNPRFHMSTGAGYDDFHPKLAAEKDNAIVEYKQRDLGDENHVEEDYEYQREQFYKLVDRGSMAIDGILDLAKEGEHPRAYEVAGQLIKNVAEVTEKLGDLQEKMKRLKEVPETGPKNVTNALFVGSTAELQKLIKGK